jgi:hypothetical protein
MCWEQTRHLAEIIALAAAAVFFLYKAVSGYLMVNMTVELTSKRNKKDETEDYVVAKAMFKKGAVGSLDIHDAWIVLKNGKKQIQTDIDDIIRFSYNKNSIKEGYKIIKWGTQSTKSPFLRLSSNESMTVEKMFLVPSEAACEIQLVVLGTRTNSRRFGQWRSSCVSLPNIC